MDFYCPNVPPAHWSPSSCKRAGEKQDSVDRGWNQMFHKFIFTHPVLSSLPLTAKSQGEAVTRDSVPHRRASQRSPLQQTLSLTYMFDFTEEAAWEPSHDG